MCSKDLNHSKIFDVGKNLATRPEINIIANLLCEVAIDKSGSLVEKDKEIPFLLETAELALKKLESRREIYKEVNKKNSSMIIQIYSFHSFLIFFLIFILFSFFIFILFF